MPRLPDQLLLLLALAAVAAGCKPEIGDECQLSTDCSAAADRLCDIAAPGGYCTVYNCEPNTCPEDESLCVEFGAQRSPAAECQSQQTPSPYARAFCMATCESDGDCRDGYVCVDLRQQKNRSAWGALLIDRDRGNRACLAKQRTTPVPEDTEAGVCRLVPDAPGDDGSADGGAPSSVPGTAGASGQASNGDAAAGAGGDSSAAAAGAGGTGG